MAAADKQRNKLAHLAPWGRKFCAGENARAFTGQGTKVFVRGVGKKSGGLFRGGRQMSMQTAGLADVWPLEEGEWRRR